MQRASVVLIHPPAAKPCEPPAGIARLAGALRTNGITCAVIDANIEGLLHLLGHCGPFEDTWSRRAHRHLDSHLALLRRPDSGRHPDRYRRAVADIGRLLAMVGRPKDIHAGLADYRDNALSPLRSIDLLRAAQAPERTPYHPYFQQYLVPHVQSLQPVLVGISINFLSQALCAFALIGLLRNALPGARILIGGGLVTSWRQWPRAKDRLAGLVDGMIAGPGESVLLGEMGVPSEVADGCLPDYADLVRAPYLSPGFILPFSASDGCWWRRCAFCPERAEQRPFRPLPHSIAVAQLRRLAVQTRPILIHMLDNALSPALLKAMAAVPPGAPWYGFARIAPPLDDPAFCRRLAAAGCVMLKIGLESGCQTVLDRLQKGVHLTMASRVLHNLHQAGIAVYVYLLFGTPAEDEASARKTLDFVVAHRPTIGFLNVALFNLPIGSPDADGLSIRDFYDGDMALYRDFDHPRGWQRAAVRRFLDKRFKRHPAVQSILRCDPPVFSSNHAAFFIQELGNGVVPSAGDA